MLLLLTAAASAVAGQPEGTPEKNQSVSATNDHSLIVRFDRGLTKEQAVGKLKKAGVKLTEVISAERNTYLAQAKDSKAMQAAIKTLGKDKQVMYAESEKSYQANSRKSPAGTRATKKFRVVSEAEAGVAGQEPAEK